MCCNPTVRRPIDIERQHRQAMHAGEMEQRQVELVGEAPDLRPIDLAQEGGFVQFALGPAVEHRLDAPREHLEAEDHVGSVAEQRRDRVELPTMVLRLVVRLPEQHDPALGECHEHVISFFVTSGIDPGAHRHAAAGLRGADTEQSDWARRYETRRKQEQVNRCGAHEIP